MANSHFAAALRWGCAALLLVGQQSLALAAETRDSASVPHYDHALERMLASPEDFDYANLWHAVLNQGDEEGLASYRVLNKFVDAYAPTDDECATHADTVRAALTRVPVSIALHTTAAQCAATDELAQAHVHAIAGFIRLMDKPFVGALPAQPYRVLLSWDADALIQALGYEVHSLWFTQQSFLDGLPLTYLVSSPELGEQRRFVHVDYFDAYATVVENARGADEPLLRYQILVESLASGIDDEKPVDVRSRAADAVARVTEGTLTIERARRAVIEVRASNPSALAHWIAQSRAHGFPNSAQASDVDLLLDSAETGDPMSLALLAVLHDSGDLVEQDSELALGFYEALKQQLVHEQAVTTMVSFWISGAFTLSKGQLLDAVLFDLQKLARDHGNASFLLATLQLKDPSLTVEGTAQLNFEHSLGQGFGPATFYVGRGQQGEIEQLEKALQSWNVTFLRTRLAELLITANRLDDAMPHIERLIRNGDFRFAKLFVAQFLAQAPTDDRLQVAIQLLLVGVLNGHEHLEDQAFRLLGQSPTGASAQLFAAEIAAQIAKVEAKAESRNGDAQLLLARILRDGLAGDKRRSEATRWLHKAQKNGVFGAFDVEAVQLATEKSNVKKAITLIETGITAVIQKAPLTAEKLPNPALVQLPIRLASLHYLRGKKTQAERVINEFWPKQRAEMRVASAYQLCTDLRAAKLGLELVNNVMSQDNADMFLITLAMCQAQTGDFEAATATQTLVVEREVGKTLLGTIGMLLQRQRLRLFQLGEIPIE